MMNGFDQALSMTLIKRDPKTWRVDRPLVYYTSLVAGGRVEVPVGFETDLASVPRLPFVYLATGGTAEEAAVIHDYLYRTGSAPREVADAIFLEAMEQTGISWWRRKLMYMAVRAAGWTAYKG
jgi:hypothetical protein